MKFSAKEASEKKKKEKKRIDADKHIIIYAPNDLSWYYLTRYIFRRISFTCLKILFYKQY